MNPYDVDRRYQRKVRRRSIALAVALHVAVCGAALYWWSTGIQRSLETVKPLATGELVRPIKDAADRPVTRTKPTAPPPPEMAVEPEAGIIESVANRILNFDSPDVPKLSLDDVRDKAALLERISSREEIDKMAAKLRSALGTEFEGIDMPDDAPPVNWDDALPAGAERFETSRRLEIHEIYVDPAGGRSVMVHVRETATDTREIRYTSYLIERGVKGDPMPVTKEVFDEVVARTRPFDVINDYPLLGELHRSAVLPILHKLVSEKEAEDSK